MVRPLVIAATAGAVLLVLAAVALARGSQTHATKIDIPAFSAEQLSATPGDDWIVTAGDIWGRRHSSLTEITPSNVTKLKQAFHVVLNTKKKSEVVLQLPGEANPLEYKGTLFQVDNLGHVYAIDATTGKRLWTFAGQNPKVTLPAAAKKGVFPIAGPWASARGLAINDGMVFAEELWGNVVALDASTGKLIWNRQIAPASQGIGLSQPPVVVNGVLYGATSGGDTGFSCVVFALDEKTGKLLWKFNVIPQSKADPGYQTWAHPLAFNGGGAMWAQLSVDASTNMVYASVGNPIPYSGLLRGPGKEYYTCGQLALDAKTGQLKWFFQEVHHDIWDADQSQQGMLFDFKYNGTVRHAMVSANKNGLWYVLDRTNGQPIIPVDEVKTQQSKLAHTWPTQPIPRTDPLIPQSVPDRAKWKGLTAPDGKPYNIGPGGSAGTFAAIDSTHYTPTTGLGNGASGNKPASIDQDKGLLFEMTTPGFSALKNIPTSELSKIEYFNFDAILSNKIDSLANTPAAKIAGSRIEAMNLETGKMVWKIDHLASANKKGSRAPQNTFTGGIATSPGIVWTFSHQTLQAYDETNGKLLWQSPKLKSTVLSPPTIYSAGGKQYVVAYCSGTGDLYAFSLA